MDTNNLLYLRHTDVPPSFAVCFIDACPRHADCLHYVAGQAVCPQRDHGPAVFPCALKADNSCRFFYQIRIIRAAWGFKSLFRNVRHEDYNMLRNNVMALFGCDRNFYRYNKGDYKLTPEQQERVLAVFRRLGYDTTDFHFDHYEEQVDFIGA